MDHINVSSQLYLFDIEAYFSSDLFMIDFESYLENPDQGSLEWVEYKQDKSFPLARWGHACISHLNNIYIIGYKGCYSN